MGNDTTIVVDSYGYCSWFPWPYDYSRSLWEIVEHFRVSNGLEIGLYSGQSASAYLSASAPLNGVLLSVDPTNQYLIDGIVSLFPAGRFEWRQGSSPDALTGLLQGNYDYIYIDGDHTYRAVLADLEAALPLLSKDGIIVCDDYSNQPEDLARAPEMADVHRAVDEFARRYGLCMSKPTDYGLTAHPNGAVILRRAKSE